jgi:hypothetical protein
MTKTRCKTTSEELIELKKISKIFTLANAKTLEIELSKYATTDERKKAWILIDGNRLPEEIGKNSGMKLRTIQLFLKILVDATLIENYRGKPPKRLIDFVPASWLELMKTDEKKPQEEKVDESK